MVGEQSTKPLIDMSDDSNPQLRSVTNTQTLKLLEKEIEEIKGINEEILVTGSRSSTLYSKLTEEHASLDDFQTLKSIGQGSYGKVYLVRNVKQESDKLYAMKIIRKDLLIDQKKIQQAYVEKEILNTVRFLLT